MANETVARRYATAVFQLAEEAHVIEGVGKDLRALASAIFDDEGTKRFYLSPVVDRKEKEKLLAGVFSNKAHEIAMHTVLLLVRKRRELLLPEIVRQYDALEMQARGAESLQVTAARQMNPGELDALVQRLQKLYGKKFEVRQRVDPSLIGGVRVMIGDRRIDGSVEGRLEELTRTLFAQT